MQDDSSLLDASLGRAAEALGDITQPVMERFYRAFPEAERAFEQRGLPRRASLEAEMVERALYFVMNWRDRPNQLRIELRDSVPHHEETLAVTLPWFRGLVDSLIEVIAETVPREETAELALLSQIRAELEETIEDSKSEFVDPPHEAV
ncbi:MAG: hypothetical protein JO127_03405 [Caulobacteraceae bacterium]|nr:hypothetical protein [Caulobacteraceae bacterium]